MARHEITISFTDKLTADKILQPYALGTGWNGTSPSREEHNSQQIMNHLNSTARSYSRNQANKDSQATMDADIAAADMQFVIGGNPITPGGA